MTKKRYYYQIKYHPSGEVIDSRDSDEYFETEDDAKWYAEETASAGGMGAEILHLADPNEYPDAETEDFDIHIYKE